MRGQKGSQLAQNPVMAGQKGAPGLAKKFRYVGKRESDGVPQVQQLSFGLREASEGVVQRSSRFLRSRKHRRGRWGAAGQGPQSFVLHRPSMPRSTPHFIPQAIDGNQHDPTGEPPPLVIVHQPLGHFDEDVLHQFFAEFWVAATAV